MEVPTDKLQYTPTVTSKLEFARSLVLKNDYPDAFHVVDLGMPQLMEIKSSL